MFPPIFLKPEIGKIDSGLELIGNGFTSPKLLEILPTELYPYAYNQPSLLNSK